MLMPMLWNDDNDLFNVSDPFDAMDQMMNRFWNGSGLNEIHSMKTDIVDEGTSYRLEAELPGFQKSDISISLKDGVLTIGASHGTQTKENQKYLRKERESVSYERSFRVDKNLKPEDIHAAYENGVLTVTLPRKEAASAEAEAKEIEIH